MAGETPDSYPFDISFDEHVELSSVVFRVKFQSEMPVNKDEVELKIEKWADKGTSDEGFGGERMHYLESEPDEEGQGGFKWDPKEKTLEFYADMGDAGVKVFSALFTSLNDMNLGIESIRMRTDY